jgi:hypothetical protein
MNGKLLPPLPTEPGLGVSGLEALQAGMASYLLQPDGTDPMFVADVQSPVVGEGVQQEGALRRLGIYHGAYRARLIDALGDSYGHTLRLLGHEAFDALALAYIEATPSRHGNLRWYGRSWPEMLEAQASPDVAELARLDWALRAAFDGSDDSVLGLQDVQALPPEAWEAACMRPHATARCLPLSYNTLQRWHALDEERDVPAVESLPEPGYLLVWRRDERPHFRSMSAHEAWAVRQLLAGVTWGALCDGLAQAWPDQDAATLAAQCLRRWLDEGLLAEVTVAV